MRKLAAPYFNSIVENLSLLEEVKQQAIAKDIEVLNSEECQTTLMLAAA